MIDTNARGAAWFAPVAFYLPQFHPIPENDAWWGKGFTEWTSTAKARPLFNGHYQPHIPADLGFYDLRVPETQGCAGNLGTEMRNREGFCYYHYWFGNGRRLLERVFDDVLSSGEPDFPFCLCWANQSWTGLWYGSDKVLIEQIYPGEEDYQAHFAWLLKAFRDPRYIRVNGCPLFLVFYPHELPNAREVCDLWRRLGRDAGLPGLHLLAVRHQMDVRNFQLLGFDGIVDNRLPLSTAEYHQWPTVFSGARSSAANAIRDSAARSEPCALSVHWPGLGQYPSAGKTRVCLCQLKSGTLSGNGQACSLCTQRPASRATVSVSEGME